ncbi:uncharacterized protein LOC114266001 isoform X1 [Camellia sinensis]|uniref:uncharacterized protein LOC114266001 isoform X1 n=1 Tax=Camellia sinensis TaxID=4442 RepID=UPI0010369B34|nr:uncharacterized protein LOC114266001 isoform X1 [Camellia sinensis]
MFQHLIWEQIHRKRRCRTGSLSIPCMGPLDFSHGSVLLVTGEKHAVRESLRASKKEFNKIEDDLKLLQSIGQIIGEVLRPLDNERCNYSFLLFFISIFFWGRGGF